MEYLYTIFQGVSGVGVFIMLLIAWKTGMLADIMKLKKNGNGEVKEKLDSVLAELANVQTNHLHELGEKLTNICRTLERIDQNQTRNFTGMYERFEKMNEVLVYLKAKSNGKP